MKIQAEADMVVQEGPPSLGKGFNLVGKADLPGALPQNHDAALWRHGEMIDLGTVPDD